MSARSNSRRGDQFKRLIDLVIAAPALVLLSPLMAFVALIIRMDLGTPILFRQVRPGLGGRPFTLLKFRTMRPAADGVADQVRLSRVSGWIRRWSLDELPQLINVLRGELSLVGPRPLLMEYLPLYSPDQMRRHEVRPGVTGWAQINGRNALTWEEKFALDLWYVEHRSLLLDLQILIRTVGSMISGRGISAEGHATMPRFTGDRTDRL